MIITNCVFKYFFFEMFEILSKNIVFDYRCMSERMGGGSIIIIGTWISMHLRLFR